MATRRVGWYRHTAGVQAAEKGRNKVESGRIDKQYSLAGKTHVLQAGSNGAGSSVELGVRQNSVIELAIKQINKCRLIRTFLGVVVQHAYKIIWSLMWTNSHF